MLGATALSSAKASELNAHQSLLSCHFRRHAGKRGEWRRV
jgi:hypothetical protein